MSKDKPDPNWGGARAGAGRQSLGKLPSKQIGFKLPGEVVEQLDALREGKESLHAAARRLLLEHLEQIQEEKDPFAHEG